uniref:GNAT family N-acetyltransferase n=1 Tax=Candidatus Limisoma sp. TaxID=3076476 RepID=UPI004025C342
RVRRTLRHAEEEGVVVKASYDYATFWKILSDNLSNKYQAAPVHTLDEIELLHSRFPDNIRLHMAYIGEEAVAGAVMFVDGNVAHAQYSSANERGSATGALCSLFNQLIRVDYADHRYYDFGTSNEQHGLFLNTNLIEMKTGHGGRGIAHQIYKVDIK